MVFDVCSGSALPFDLNEAAQTRLAIRFTANAAGYCADFGGSIVRDRPATSTSVGLFKAVRAPAPTSCEVP